MPKLKCKPMPQTNNNMITTARSLDASMWTYVRVTMHLCIVVYSCRPHVMLTSCARKRKRNAKQDRWYVQMYLYNNEEANSTAFGWCVLACLRVDDNEGELNHCIFRLFIRLTHFCGPSYSVAVVHTYTYTPHRSILNAVNKTTNDQKSDSMLHWLDEPTYMLYIYISMVIIFGHGDVIQRRRRRQQQQQRQ